MRLHPLDTAKLIFLPTSCFAPLLFLSLSGLGASALEILLSSLLRPNRCQERLRLVGESAGRIAPEERGHGSALLCALHATPLVHLSLADVLDRVAENEAA